jgi:hypothetical protein
MVDVSEDQLSGFMHHSGDMRMMFSWWSKDFISRTTAYVLRDAAYFRICGGVRRGIVTATTISRSSWQ